MEKFNDFAKILHAGSPVAEETLTMLDVDKEKETMEKETMEKEKEKAAKKAVAIGKMIA